MFHLCEWGVLYKLLGLFWMGDDSPDLFIWPFMSVWPCGYLFYILYY